MASTLGKIITFNHGGLVVHLQTEDEVREAVRAGTLVGSTKVRIHGADGEEASGIASAIALLAAFFGDDDGSLPTSAVATEATRLTPASAPRAAVRRAVDVTLPAAGAASQLQPSSNPKRVEGMMATKADIATSPSSFSAVENPSKKGDGGTVGGWGCGLVILGIILAVTGASSFAPWVFWPGLLLLVIAWLANLENNNKK